MTDISGVTGILPSPAGARKNEMIEFTIDPRGPFKWLEFCIVSRTIVFTL